MHDVVAECREERGDGRAAERSDAGVVNEVQDVALLPTEGGVHRQDAFLSRQYPPG